MAAVYVPQAAPQPWKSPLFGCFDDIGSCLMACFCPCVLYGQIQEQLDGTGCCSHCCVLCCCLTWGGCWCLVHGPRRRYLRQSYGLVEDCDDCIVSWCCLCCALAQEMREVNARGPPVRQTMVAVPAMAVYAQQPVAYAQPVQYAQQPVQYAQQPVQYAQQQQQQPPVQYAQQPQQAYQQQPAPAGAPVQYQPPPQYS